MTERWVANASPLILLGKVGQVELLTGLSEELVIPERVAQEVGVRPEGRDLLSQLELLGGARLAGPIPVPPDINVWDLGAGESQVLALANESSGSRTVLDDLEARRCASSLSIPVIGTLGVVLRAKRKSLIPSARPVITSLRKAGLYISDSLVEQALEHIGE